MRPEVLGGREKGGDKEKICGPPPEKAEEGRSTCRM